MLREQLIDRFCRAPQRQRPAAHRKLDPRHGKFLEPVMPRPLLADDGYLVAPVAKALAKIEQIPAQAARVAGAGEVEDFQRFTFGHYNDDIGFLCLMY
jgi:hypothetical protein